MNTEETDIFRIAIFGAKSIALGVCLAVQELYGENYVIGFLVSNKDGNPDTLAGLPVYSLESYQDKQVCILVAVPEDIQEEVVGILEEKGFHNHICVDSVREAFLMEKYYERIGVFQSVHTL